MDDTIFKPVDETKYAFILEGDPRLKIFECIASLASHSKRQIDMYWPRTIWDYYIEKGRITYRQFNVLLSIYETEWAVERASEEREKSLNFEEPKEEKIINVKFA